jgi:hypothetical protein
MTFNPEIVSVDTCRVYHSGPKYFVEVDIVLDPEMPLWKAHDISQDLQDQIEALPDVDRCFVHVDHEVDHKPVSESSDTTNAMLKSFRSIGRRFRIVVHFAWNAYIFRNISFQQLYYAGGLSRRAKTDVNDDT